MHPLTMGVGLEKEKEVGMNGFYFLYHMELDFVHQCVLFYSKKHCEV